MKINIPDDIFPVYKDLTRRFDLEIDTFNIHSKKIYILKPNNIIPIVENIDEKSLIAQFPYWAKIWEASLALAEFVSSLPATPPLNILEIGAGLGISGISASLSGHKVTISDYKADALSFTKISARISGCKDIHFSLLDWTKPVFLGKFDIIIGSEIVFNRQVFQPLINIFAKFLKKDGTIYLAHDINRQSLRDFFALCEDQYSISVVKRTINMNGHVSNILLARFLPKK